MTDETTQEPEAPAEGADEEEEASGGDTRKRKFFLLLAGVVALFATFVPVFLFFMKDDTRTQEDEFNIELEEEVAQETRYYLDMDPFIVNLNTAPGERRVFLKIQVALEVSSSDDIDTVRSIMPRIVDHFQVYLRELRVEDLRGSAGIQRLREELMLRIIPNARPAKILDVLFQEILVQ